MTLTTRPLTCLRVLAIIAIGQTFQTALAQQCYYPNGQEASEKPCSSASGSHCCPDKWVCLDNGLCHYPPDKLFGTYSCTDKSWKAPGCPSNLCTMKLTRPGGESMTQCSSKNNQWCCNADNTNVKCCEESPSPRPFFALKSGSAYATIGARTANQAPILNTIVGEATSGDASYTPTATPTPSQSQSQSQSQSEQTPSSNPPSTPITSLQTSLSTGSTGIHTIIKTIETILPPASQTSPPATPASSSSSSKTPLIIGLALGIPLALAFFAILTWLFRKRALQKKSQTHSPSSLSSPNPYAGSTVNGSSSPSFAGGAKMSAANAHASTYKAETNVPELAGQPVGPERPVSTIKGRAELESGSGFAPGHAAPYAADLVGVGGGTQTQAQTRTSGVSSWGSAPPGYSPGRNHEGWGSAGQQGAGVVEADGVPVSGQATEGGRYIPYRPPQDQAHGHGHGHTQNLADLPEMAEMSAVRTPPAVETTTTAATARAGQDELPELVSGGRGGR